MRALSVLPPSAFVPLDIADAIAEEARAMKNCLLNYGDAVAEDRSRLWSVRRDGRRIATLEVGFPGNDPLPMVSELSGPSNDRAPTEVWIVARRWLNAHNVEAMGYRGRWNPDPYPRTTWLRLWRPYWLAQRHVGCRCRLRSRRSAICVGARTGAGAGAIAHRTYAVSMPSSAGSDRIECRAPQAEVRACISSSSPTRTTRRGR